MSPPNKDTCNLYFIYKFNSALTLVCFSYIHICMRLISLHLINVDPRKATFPDTNMLTSLLFAWCPCCKVPSDDELVDALLKFKRGERGASWTRTGRGGVRGAWRQRGALAGSPEPLLLLLPGQKMAKSDRRLPSTMSVKWRFLQRNPVWQRTQCCHPSEVRQTTRKR